MVKFMFSHRFTCQVAMPMALFGITFCSDRGYWTVPLILLLLGLGATVFSTLCCMEWVPYTYDQVLKGKDKREKIMEKNMVRCTCYFLWLNDLYYHFIYIFIYNYLLLIQVEVYSKYLRVGALTCSRP